MAKGMHLFPSNTVVKPLYVESTWLGSGTRIDSCRLEKNMSSTCLFLYRQLSYMITAGTAAQPPHLKEQRDEQMRLCRRIDELM